MYGSTARRDLGSGGWVTDRSTLILFDLSNPLGDVLLIASSGCLSINGEFGVSSGWIRYVTTTFAITSALDRFQLDWAQSFAWLSGRTPESDELTLLLEQISQFTNRVNQLVENVSRAWGIQFQENLSEFERVVRAKDRPCDQSRRDAVLRRQSHDNY